MEEIANNKKTKGNPAWGKGISGNPNGRPKLPEEFRELAKVNSVKALEKAINMMQDPEVPPAVQLKAAEIVMDRAWGKATLPISGPDGEPLTVKLEGALGEWAK